MDEAAAVERNLRLSLETLARNAPGGEVKELPGVVAASSGIRVSLLNAAMFRGPVGSDRNSLERRVEIAALYYRLRGLPWSFWVCTHTLPPGLGAVLGDLLGQRGLRGMVRCSGMAGRVSKLPRRAFTRTLRVGPVKDAESRLAFCHVVAHCFGIPFEAAAGIYQRREAWKLQEGWIGYAGGMPVSTAATLAAGDVVGLYSVGTLPEYRRRGFAAEISRHAVLQAYERHGVRLAVLEATRPGEGVYRKLGFREVTAVHTFFMK